MYNAWCSTLAALGLPFEQFSASRYGHLDPALPVLADGVPLAAHCAGKTVIIPNTPFDLGTPTAPLMRTPTTLLPGGAVRSQLPAPGVGALKGPAKFLVLSDGTTGEVVVLASCCQGLCVVAVAATGCPFLVWRACECVRVVARVRVRVRVLYCGAC